MSILPFPRPDVASAKLPTVAQIVQLYLDQIELRSQAGTLSAASRARARYYLGDFSGKFGELTVDQCRNGDLTRWLLERPRWKSPATKSDALTAVLNCFRWAASPEERYLPYCPYSRPKGLPKPRPRAAFDEAEYRRFMHASRNHPGERRRPSSMALRVAIYFLWRSGCRTCEVRNGLWPDVQWENGVIELPHHKTEVATGEDRLIGLDERLLRILRWLHRTRKPDSRACACEEAKRRPHAREDHIFRNGRGGAWTKDSFARLFRTFANRAGIDPKKSAYSLRHGFCVQAITRGLADREIADQMGHASTRQIAWYGRQSRQRAEHLRNIVRRVHRDPGEK
jgi:integrase